METMVFGPWETTNTNGSRPGIKDTELYFTDGFMPVGAGRLRTMPDIGDLFFYAPKPNSAAPLKPANRVSFFDFFNIATVPYCFVVTSDGHMWSIDLYTDTVLELGYTITNPTTTNLDIASWGTQWVLIVASEPNGYFISDGINIYRAGDTVPGIGVVPTGISGTAIEIYQQRVWIANGATVTFSAPQSFIDFSTASGGGQFTSIDSFLRVQLPA